jgi:hypothetical protein
MIVTEKQGNDFRTTTSCIESTGASSLARFTWTRSAPNPVRISSRLPDGRLDLLQEWLGLQTSAGIDPRPPATHTSGPHMKIVALIGCHRPTILVGYAPRKSCNTSIAQSRSDAHEIE